MSIYKTCSRCKDDKELDSFIMRLAPLPVRVLIVRLVKKIIGCNTIIVPKVLLKIEKENLNEALKEIMESKKIITINCLNFKKVAAQFANDTSQI